MIDYDKVIPEKIRNIQPSGIRKFFDIAQQVEGVISLSVGEPDFKTPWAARKAAIGVLEKGRTAYTANAGLIQLREEISKYLLNFIHTEYDPNGEIIVTVGGSEALDLAMRALIQPGDEVLVPEPSFVCYSPIITVCGGTPVPIVMTEEDKFKLRADALKAKITPRTKALILPFPNNPTGEAITKEQLQVWVDYANKAGAVIIYDAAYKAYITEKDIPVSIYQCEGAKTCAIELCSFSKTAGFTGLRLAYTVIPKELKCGDVQLHALWARRHGTKYNGAPYIIQRAGEAVYSEAGKAQIAEQIAYYHKNASYIFNGLKEAGYTVAGGVNSPYVWLKTPEQMNSWEFFDYLLEKANVVGTPGSGFGPSGEGYFRLTAFGTYENTVKAIDRIKKL